MPSSHMHDIRASRRTIDNQLAERHGRRPDVSMNQRAALHVSTAGADATPQDYPASVAFGPSHSGLLRFPVDDTRLPFDYGESGDITLLLSSGSAYQQSIRPGSKIYSIPPRARPWAIPR